jgi:ribose transport system permease protein
MGENKLLSSMKKFRFKDHSLGMAFLILVVIATILGWPNFLKIRNLTNILRQISYTGIIGLGMTLVIISGGIDLSVGSMTAFVGGIAIYFLNLFGPESIWGIVLTFLFALVLGSLCGALNGLLVAKFKMAPFIVTLGTMSIFRSLIQYFSNAGTGLVLLHRGNSLAYYIESYEFWPVSLCNRKQ